MDFPIARFEGFCSSLRITPKESTGQQPLKWLGSQRYFVNEIADGLAHDVHTFVVLKGRQMGISTICCALDLYWLFKFPGTQGAIVTDSDENRDLFRSYLTQYMDSIPLGLGVKPGKVLHNRNQFVLDNESRLMYMVAGLKKSGNLGRAKSVNFMHATECSSWGDEEGYLSLTNTLAQVNPNRLYVFESTARGYNAFYEILGGGQEIPHAKGHLHRLVAQRVLRQAPAQCRVSHLLGRRAHVG